MAVYVLRRLLLMVPTTIGIALVVFLLYHAVPGDPATVAIGMGGGGEMGQETDYQAQVDAFRREHGLDRSLAVQFLNYIGPINLLRDGHSWFKSPYGERRTEELTLSDGSSVVEGEPLAIEHLSGTAPEKRERIDEAVARLEDENVGERAWAEAAEELTGQGRAALPALLSALYRMQFTVVESGQAIERVSAVLTRISGHEAAPSAERLAANGQEALIRHWFGWYYQNGGHRVRNTGKKPWGGLFTFDLGREMERKTSVADELVRRLQVTVPLSLTAVMLSYLIALPLGIFSVRKQHTRADAVVTVMLFVLYSIPTFWAGLMLILVFGATGLAWLPILGLHSQDAVQMSGGAWLWDLIKHCILPVITLTYVSLAYLSRQMRAGMLEVIRQDYIRTARAKGMSERVVVYKHALRNALIPVITIFASVLPILIGGSIIVETVFDLPGMGKYAFEGLLRRDFYIVMATTVFVGIMTQFGILLSDVTYSLVDPRIRYD